MRLYTASWFASLPDNIARIGISRGTPRRQSGYRMYRKLAPGPWFNSVSVERYRELYAEILAGLNPRQVVDDVQHLAQGREAAALLCFERPPPDPAWCHRALVSQWLHDTIGMEVTEFGHEGFGAAHPKRARPESDQPRLALD